jgi:hypothetical protein
VANLVQERMEGEKSHEDRRKGEKSRRDRREGEKSRGNRDEGERSHRSGRHRDNEESRHSHQEAKMKDLEDKYTRMLLRMDGEDPELMAWDMLEDESLLFN